MKGLTPEDFRKRDIYIDYPYEHAMFRWEKETKSVYTRFYGKREHEIDQTSEFFTRPSWAAGRSPATRISLITHPTRR